MLTPVFKTSECRCESFFEAVVQRAFVHWSLKDSLEGPAGHCHGGCLAALLDDAFGSFVNTHLKSVGRSGQAMTARLDMTIFQIEI